MVGVLQVVEDVMFYGFGVGFIGVDFDQLVRLEVGYEDRIRRQNFYYYEIRGGFD